jgi:hypothetical protein
VAQELVGGGIARLAQRLEAQHPAFAHRDQQLARHVGEVGGQFGVVHITGLQLPITRSTMRSAASSGVSRVVSMRISGVPGLHRGCRCR